MPGFGQRNVRLKLEADPLLRSHLCFTRGLADVLKHDERELLEHDRITLKRIVRLQSSWRIPEG
jgi:hypothetical protein